jgi:hypothetical protein
LGVLFGTHNVLTRVLRTRRVLHTAVKRSRARSARTAAAVRSSYVMHGLRACACAAADINSGARTDPPTRAPTFRGGARRAHWMPPSPPMGAGLVPRHYQYRTGGGGDPHRTPREGRPGPRPTADAAALRRGLCWRGTSARAWRRARGYSWVLTGTPRRRRAVGGDGVLFWVGTRLYSRVAARVLECAAAAARPSGRACGAAMRRRVRVRCRGQQRVPGGLRADRASPMGLQLLPSLARAPLRIRARVAVTASFARMAAPPIARLPKLASRRRSGPREPLAQATAKCRQQARLLAETSPTVAVAATLTCCR